MVFILKYEENKVSFKSKFYGPSFVFLMNYFQEFYKRCSTEFSKNNAFSDNSCIIQRAISLLSNSFRFFFTFQFNNATNCITRALNENH